MMVVVELIPLSTVKEGSHDWGILPFGWSCPCCGDDIEGSRYEPEVEAVECGDAEPDDVWVGDCDLCACADCGLIGHISADESGAWANMDDGGNWVQVVAERYPNKHMEEWLKEISEYTKKWVKDVSEVKNDSV